MHINGLATIDLHCRAVTVVRGLEQDDFVAGVYECADRGEDGVGGARRDGDFGLRVVSRTIQRVHFFSDGLTQANDAAHRRILIQPGVDVFAKQCAQLRGAIEVGEALRQIDGFVISGQLRHHGEDGGAYVGQLGIDLVKIVPHDS